MSEIKQLIVDQYLKFVTTKAAIPTFADLITEEINRDTIRRQFGNLTKLHEYVRTNFPEFVGRYFVQEDEIFNEKRLKTIRDQFGDCKTFIITTAVSHKKVDRNLYQSIKHYLNKRDGRLIIIPSDDIASRNSRSTNRLAIDPVIRNEFFVAEEFRLNNNLFISNIKVSAKQIVPTTGMSRIGQTNGSYIFASPKQMLEFVATSPKQLHPKAITTTGAITVNDYNKDRWMSQRTSYIAEHDHVMGGVIVEIIDDQYFHFRHFQANHFGQFVDLGVRYFPDGSSEKVTTHMYVGDWHSGQTNQNVMQITLLAAKKLNVEDMFVGDFFDGYSISHHHVGNMVKQAQKSLYNKNDLIKELEQGGAEINLILRYIKGKLYMIKGNHDEVLERYLTSGNYVKDTKNHYVALTMAKWMIEQRNVLKCAYDHYGQIDDFDRIVWLDRDDEHKVGGVECGQHGDLGANGSKGTLLSLEKAYGNCIVGHTHSAAIMRGVYRVGTLTELFLEYNKGPSSWTQSNCLIYEDGSRQLIHAVNGEFYAGMLLE